jgi:hypothetical protein
MNELIRKENSGIVTHRPIAVILKKQRNGWAGLGPGIGMYQRPGYKQNSKSVKGRHDARIIIGKS